MLHLSRLLKIFKTFLINADPPFAKAVLYRDAVSVDTGSRRFFCSVSVSKTPFLVIGGVKDTLPLCSKDTLNVSKNLDTVPVSAIADC